MRDDLLTLKMTPEMATVHITATGKQIAAWSPGDGMYFPYHSEHLPSGTTKEDIRSYLIEVSFPVEELCQQ